MIVTVSRLIGAGGSEIASRVAAALGFRLVDNELIDRVALQAGLSRTEVANREERAPGFLERLVRALSRSAPEIQSAPPDRPPEPEEKSLVAATEKVVAELAAEGRVVLVGRAAPAVLSGSHDALHVKIVAPVPFRIAQIRKADGWMSGRRSAGSGSRMPTGPATTAITMDATGAIRPTTTWCSIPGAWGWRGPRT